MKRKALVTTILAVLLLTMCATMFCACVDEEPEPKEVELELVNPATWEKVEWGETIDLPEEGTPIRARIKDKETGEYLTDDDLPENTVKGSYYLTFFALLEDGTTIRSWNTYGYWPTKEVLEKWPTVQAVVYEVRISFDCRPDNPKDKKFYRRYERKTDYVRFYINKSWRDEDNINN